MLSPQCQHCSNRCANISLITTPVNIQSLLTLRSVNTKDANAKKNYKAMVYWRKPADHGFVPLLLASLKHVSDLFKSVHSLWRGPRSRCYILTFTIVLPLVWPTDCCPSAVWRQIQELSFLHPTLLPRLFASTWNAGTRLHVSPNKNPWNQIHPEITKYAIVCRI